MPRCFAAECNARYFPNREALHQHLRTSARPHPVCIPCERRFISDTALSEHTLAVHPPKFSCVECERDYRTKSALYDHYRGSPSDRHPNCPKCGEGFRNISERNIHHSENHPQATCTCGDIVYIDRIDTHFKERSPPHVVCEICSRGFRDTCQLALHNADPDAHLIPQPERDREGRGLPLSSSSWAQIPNQILSNSFAGAENAHHRGNVANPPTFAPFDLEEVERSGDRSFFLGNGVI